MSLRVLLLLAAFNIIPTAASMAANPASVTGSALITFFDGGEQHWQFTAYQESGGAKGQLQLATSQESGGRLHGSIVCVNVSESGQARIGARVENSTTPLAPAGTFLIWTVVDRGEGRNSPRDLTSDLTVVNDLSTAIDHCTGDFGLFLVEVERGNIQVHR